MNAKLPVWLLALAWCGCARPSAAVQQRVEVGVAKAPTVAGELSGVAPVVRAHRLADGNEVCRLREGGGIECWNAWLSVARLRHSDRTFVSFSGSCVEEASPRRQLLCGNEWEPALVEDAVSGSVWLGLTGLYAREDGTVFWASERARELRTAIDETPRRMTQWCALGASGRVWCWGDSLDGAGGTLVPEDCARWHRETPSTLSESWSEHQRLRPASCDVPARRIEGLGDVIDLVGSYAHTCALAREGRVYCWGLRRLLGIEQAGDSTVVEPTHVAELGDVVELAARDRATCALRRDGSVHCWGTDLALQPYPTPMRQLPAADAIAVGEERVCALSRAGEVHCEARAEQQTPRSFRIKQPSQADLALGRPVSVALGEWHSCALDEDGAVRCWGFGEWGAVTGAAQSEVLSPQRVGGVGKAVDVAVSERASCALLETGELRCWGTLPGPVRNPSAEHARASTATRTISSNVVKLIASGGRLCTVNDPEQTVHCMGTLSTGDQRDAVAFAGLGEALSTGGQAITRVRDVVLGTHHLCVRDEAGRVYCMGDNTCGQLGLGDGLAHAGLAQVPRLPALLDLLASDDGTCGHAADGRVFCWGESTDFAAAPDARLCGGQRVIAGALRVLDEAGTTLVFDEFGAPRERMLFGAWHERPALQAAGLSAVAVGNGDEESVVASVRGALCTQSDDDPVHCWTRVSQPLPPSARCSTPRWRTPPRKRGDGTPVYPLRPYSEVRIYKYSASLMEHRVFCSDPAVSRSGGDPCPGDLRARGYPLSASEAKEVSEALSQPTRGPGAHAMCYAPRHELIFFDERAQSIARVPFCLECSNLAGTPPVPRAVQDRMNKGVVFRLLQRLCRKYALGACEDD